MSSSRPKLWTAHPLAAAGIALLVASLIAFVDRPAAKFIATSRTSASQDLAQLVSLFGSPMLYLLIGVIAIAASRRTSIQRNRVLFLVLAATTPWIWADLLKVLFGRARPALYLEDGFYGFQPLDMDPRA